MGECDSSVVVLNLALPDADLVAFIKLHSQVSHKQQIRVSYEKYAWLGMETAAGVENILSSRSMVASSLITENWL